MEEKDPRVAPPTVGEAQSKSRSLGRTSRIALLVVVAVALALIGTGVFLLTHQQESDSSRQSTPTASDSVQGMGEEKNPSAAVGEDTSKTEASEQPENGDFGETSSNDAATTIDETADNSTSKKPSQQKNDSTAFSAKTSQSSRAADTITVSISIDASRAGSEYASVSRSSQPVTLNKDATVFDALVSIGATIGGDASYVKSIDGLAEMQKGSLSGWMYSVDGGFPQMSCGDYKLSGDEVILWVYTTNLGEDL